VCYKGKPMTVDFRKPSMRFCTGGDLYVWGFSGSFLLVGFVLEAVWCFLCMYLWAVLSMKSDLAPTTRSATGTVRNILDLSEALKHDLGGNTGWRSDKELRKELKLCPPVGYELRDRGDGVHDLALVSVLEGRTARRRLLLSDSKRQA